MKNINGNTKVKCSYDKHVRGLTKRREISDLFFSFRTNRAVICFPTLSVTRPGVNWTFVRRPTQFMFHKKGKVFNRWNTENSLDLWVEYGIVRSLIGNAKLNCITVPCSDTFIDDVTKVVVIG
jgi:hypothetical protein